eukprot:1157574-Pelagomonas_calceolata.AAC.8
MSAGDAMASSSSSHSLVGPEAGAVPNEEVWLEGVLDCTGKECGAHECKRARIAHGSGKACCNELPHAERQTSACGAAAAGIAYNK